MDYLMHNYHILFLIIAYLVGSLPTAVIVSKRWYNTDVRDAGSKNAGATNTFRVLGKKAGLVVLIIDILKGYLAVKLIHLIPYDYNQIEFINTQLCFGVAAIIGHIFPVFAGFRGGKGVASTVGIMLAVHPLGAAIAVAVFFVLFTVFQYVSLGSIIASFVFAIHLSFFSGIQNQYTTVLSITIWAIILITHQKNLERLVNGNESKMNLFKKSKQ
jgi:glycerol-3-phosphate acyltransferase PlsY